MTTTPPPTPKPRRRWLQFSLRTVLVLVLLISVPLGWLGMKVKQGREDLGPIRSVSRSSCAGRGRCAAYEPIIDRAVGCRVTGAVTHNLEGGGVF